MQNSYLANIYYCENTIPIMLSNCPACDTPIIDEGNVFCQECGCNLTIEQKENDSNSMKFEYNKNSNIIRIDQSLLTRYQELDTEIKASADIVEIYHQHKMYHAQITAERNRARQIFQNTVFIMNEEKKDVEKLEKLSWTSLKARIKGDRDEKLEIENAEYFDALSKQEAAQNDLNELENKVKLASEQLEQITDRFNYRQNLIKTQINIVHTACEGITDPVEDKIEADLKRLLNTRVPIQQSKQHLIITRDHLYQARNYFGSAIQLLQSAKSYANWDTFGGGGYYTDSVKHSKMAQARNYVQSAYRSLQIAFQNYPQLPRISYVQIEDGSFFWDVAFDNFFTDMRSRERIENAYYAVVNANNELNNSINWILNHLAQMDQKDNHLYEQIMSKQGELTRERKRMIEDAISQLG